MKNTEQAKEVKAIPEAFAGEQELEQLITRVKRSQALFATYTQQQVDVIKNLIVLMFFATISATSSAHNATYYFK